MRLYNLNIGIKLDNTSDVLENIKQFNADICTFQEAMMAKENSCFDMFKSANIIIKNANYKYNNFSPIYIAKGVEKDGVMVRAFGGLSEQGSLLISKFEINNAQNLFYYNNYKTYYDATYFKEQDWARSIQTCILNINGNPLQIINVHGIWTKDKLGDNRTIKQSQFILEHARKDIPCIIVGDFNLLPNSTSIKILNEQFNNLINLYNIKTTRPTFDDGLDKGNLVCDYIFVNNKVNVKDFKVVNSNISDHLPLILDFEI